VEWLVVELLVHEMGSKRVACVLIMFLDDLEERSVVQPLEPGKVLKVLCDLVDFRFGLDKRRKCQLFGRLA
jgi:hypothetical protein